MNFNVGHRVRCRQPTVPPFSNRTLHHPSFLPVYMATEFAHHRTDCNNQTVHPITPAEFFYTDPTMSCGRRIPNMVSELRVSDCFQLNTPPPVMSACPAPPTRPDPFRSEPHPTRDLGSLTFKINTLHPPVQPSCVILQLTQEEDQAITNLLKLHHQQPIQSDETLAALQMVSSSVELNPISFLHPDLMDSTSAEEVYKPFCSDEQYPRQQGRSWSDTELEAANTLLSCFSLMEEDIWGQNHSKSAVKRSDPLLYQHHRDSSISTETPKGSETFPALTTADCTQNDIGYIGFSCAREYGEPGWRDFGFVVGRRDDVHLPVRESTLSSDSKSKSTSGASGDFLDMKERMLSDSEGDAVQVLLSLGDMGALDIVQ
ncbi:hypothetical protein EPR50_G00197120 [Perca flavescens]|uniref:Uncharacterized protein n=1 Tax=Perca flavescens TaxID=8167 RepID=A0A484C730_PERFV|nr:uncharacterized protein LOC114545622 isoform X1 [Perca flavescens]XP_028419836.1 uncharacterized protein LOC114545622 isoform X1 [Perca flavescens]TDG99730.1 hypothetical protein EPR50_G00197120 [Perca flavescens]